MNWFYSRGGAQSGPASTDEVQALADRGELRASDLVWKDGMAEWQPLAQVGEFRLPVASAAAADSLVSSPASSGPPASANTNVYQPGLAAGTRADSGFDLGPWQPLIANAGWIKLIGVATLIMGILYAIVLIGILYIFMGLWLMNAAKYLKALQDNPHPGTAYEASRELGKIFKTTGILTVISLVFFALYIVFAIMMLIVALSTGAFANGFPS